MSTLKHELNMFFIAYKKKNHELCFSHLGRAHIISQASPFNHLKVHFIMLFYALNRFDSKEILGQFLRIIVTLPGHLLGKVPKGNIGWSTVSLTQEMPIPEDLKEVI